MIVTRALTALVVVAAGIALDVRDSAAQYRPWCAMYTGRTGAGSNCTFATYEQCMMTATPGSGAFCAQNPWYGYGPGQVTDGYGSGQRAARQRARERW